MAKNGRRGVSVMSEDPLCQREQMVGRDACAMTVNGVDNFITSECMKCACKHCDNKNVIEEISFVKTMNDHSRASQIPKRYVAVASSLRLENVHVRGVYDQIAPHIQDLKQHTWPRVKDFLDSLKPGSLVADVGCGNGRYLNVNPSVFCLGLDTCQSFLETASARGFEVLSADNLSLPFRDQMFDAVLSVGVIHHFASLERRVSAMRELVRILNKGGRMMVYVWAFEQKRRKFDGQDILVPWHKPRKSETGHNSTGSMGSSLSDDDAPNKCSEERGYLSSIPYSQRQPLTQSDCVKNSSVDTWPQNQHINDQVIIKECQKVESYLGNLSKYSERCQSLREENPVGSTLNGHEPSEIFSRKAEEAVDLVRSQHDFGSNCQQPGDTDDDDDVFVYHGIPQNQTVQTMHEQCEGISPVVNAREKMKTISSDDDWKARFPEVCKPVLVTKDKTKTTQVQSKDNKMSIGQIEKQSNVEEREASVTSNGHLETVDIEAYLGRKGTGKNGIDNLHDNTHFNHGDGIEQGLPRCPPTARKTSVIDLVKENFRSIFSKPLFGNSQLSPCLVPCHGQPLPVAENFQIRQFPQSSLPAHFSHVSEACKNPFASASKSDQLHALEVHTRPKHALSIADQNNEFLSQTAQKDCANTLPGSVTSTSKITQFPILEKENAPETNKPVNTDLCRFYHVFREGELAKLVTLYIPQVQIIDSFYDHANWCLVLEKV